MGFCPAQEVRGRGLHQAAGVGLNALQMGSNSVILHEPLFVRAGLISEVLDNQPFKPLNVLMPGCRTHMPPHFVVHKASRPRRGGGAVGEKARSRA